jgi:hypothetical protein
MSLAGRSKGSIGALYKVDRIGFGRCSTAIADDAVVTANTCAPHTPDGREENKSGSFVLMIGKGIEMAVGFTMLPLM